MLPEHKELLQQWRTSQDDIEHPVLDQSRIDEIDMLIREYMAQRSPVTVSYMNQNRLNTFNGFIQKCDPYQGVVILVDSYNEREYVPFLSIVDIQRSQA